MDDSHADKAAEFLADTVLSFPSLQNLYISKGRYGELPAEHVFQVLKQQTEEVKESDFRFRRNVLRTRARGMMSSMIFRIKRECWWKDILSQEISMNLWPLVLEKAGKSKMETSHSHLDILNFLVREKNGILLQNIHR